MKSVVIAFSNPLLTDWVSSVLKRSGYTIEYTCSTGGDTVRVSEFCTSMVIVSGFQFPDMTVEDLAGILAGRMALVTILLPHQRDLVFRNDITALPYPLSPVELIGAVDKAERETAKQAVSGGMAAERKGGSGRSAEEKLLILKAKNSLMERFGMTESQAHRYLQKNSMDHGLKIIDAARKIIEGSFEF